MSAKPKPEKPQHPTPSSFFQGCYEYPEWCLEWVLYVLSRMAIFEVLELVSRLGIIVAVVLFLLESGERQKRKQYEAWQIVIAMQGKPGNGGRIAALQDLNADRVSLSGIEAKDAYLAQIDLERANLQGANFSGATLYRANFNHATLYRTDFGCVRQEKCTDLYHANFQKADLRGADLRGADLRDANLIGAVLQDANLQKANLQGADFEGADLQGAKLECVQGLIPEQVRRGKSWQEAFYDEKFSMELV